MPVDEKSSYLHMPLPHEANTLDQDLARLRAAFDNLDRHAQTSDAAQAALRSELEARDTALQAGLERAQAELAAHGAAENPHHIPAASRVAPGLVQVGEGIALEQGVISVPPTPVATDAAPGLVRPDNVTITVTAGGTISTAGKYEICEFYFFRHPILRPGFQPAQGGLLENAATLYPEAWDYLQSVEGQLLCKEEAEWQAMTTATWAVLADGTEIGWNGIGGAPFYAPNLATGALRLPDLRGMYAEAAGFDSLGVGGVHGDGIREITGSYGDITYIKLSAPQGAFTITCSLPKIPTGSSTNAWEEGITQFNASRVVPVAAKNQPRAWGGLACVYLGPAAS